MGPISLTLDSSLHDVTPALGADFIPGQKHVLGTRVDFSQSSSNDVLAYVATATPPAGFAAGDVVYGPGYANLTHINTQLAAGVIEAVTKPADTGGQTWLYVITNDAISRGQAVMLNLGGAGVYVVTQADEAGKVVGVAQWNIPQGSYGWVLCAGYGKVLVGTAGVTAGERLEITPAGSAEDVTALADVGFGRAWETAVSGVLANATISAPC